ncbi:tetratricopeptide repeat protein [Paractinoplanes globisporus]|uniref:Tetratricopeptide repeat protein n=1 Tax=Paractinoplanes globisporus TaxID=113565 RepID=A0ABW6W9M5_9ACTN|nr:tetratricopeptide repeat protein [Actinoplanes globisporus]
MSPDDLIARLDERLKRFETSRQPELILGHEIKAEATALLAATRIERDSLPPTRDDAMRMMLAHHHVSRLYFLRSFVSDPAGDPAELAAAVLMSAWLGNMVPDLLQPEVRALVGLTPATGSESEFATTITGVLQAASMTSGDPAVLDAAVLTMRARLSDPGGDPGGRVASCLCVAYRSRFMQRGDAADLDLAIEQGVRAFEAAEGDEERMSRATNLCACYRDRFDLGGADADLDRAVSSGERALGLVPPGRPVAQVLVNLSTAYFRRFTHRGTEHAALDRCIELVEQAMAAPGGVPAPVLSNAGMAYRERFLLHGRPDDLERAVELTTRANEGGPGAEPDRAMSLANAAVVLRQRFDRLGEVADLRRAIELNRQAIAGMPDHLTNPARANLANMYRELYGRTGEIGDLSRAVDAGEGVLARMPPGHPNRATHSADLSVVYQRRFRRLGSRSDLDRAVELGEQALTGTGSRSPSIPQAAGLAHLERYLLHGVTGDLDRSIELSQRSADETPAGHIERPGRLLDAAIGYFERFRRRGAETDLTRAIAMGEEALGAMADDQPGRAQHLAELSLAHLEKFHLESGDESADRAIGLAAEAEAALAADHPDFTGILGLRCMAHQARYWLRRRRSDLDEAIAAGERALELSGPDDPRLADQVANIAVAYIGRMDHFRRSITPDRLAWLCEQAAGAGSAQPAERLRACWRVGALALAMGRAELAVPLLDQAVDLLPATAPREGDWADQEHRLGSQPDLVSQAVAAHCTAGDPGGALAVAEAGRAGPSYSPTRSDPVRT